MPTHSPLAAERRLTHLFSSDVASPSYDPDFHRSPLPDWRPCALVDWAEKLYCEHSLPHRKRDGDGNDCGCVLSPPAPSHAALISLLRVVKAVVGGGRGLDWSTPALEPPYTSLVEVGPRLLKPPPYPSLPTCHPRPSIAVLLPSPTMTALTSTALTGTALMRQEALAELEDAWELMIRRAAGGVPRDPTAWPQRVGWWEAKHGLALARKCNELWRRALAGSGARGSAEWGSAFAQTGMLLNLERLKALPGDGPIRFDDEGVAHVDEEEEEEEEAAEEEAAAAADSHRLGLSGAEADCGDAKEGIAGELAVGRRVRIHGLKGRQDLNGSVGSVISLPNERGRWGVAVAFRLANGRWKLQECVQVKADNLQTCPPP